MREDVLLRPALEIKQDTMREELEAGARQPLASLSGQHCIQPTTQSMQVENVGSGIPKLLFGQDLGSPIRALLLF